MSFGRRMRVIFIFSLCIALLICPLTSCSSMDLTEASSEESTTLETVNMLTTPTLSPTPTISPTPSPTPLPETINISLIGDCTLADHIGWSGSAGSFDRAYDDYGYSYFFQNARGILSADDMTLANFEGTITDSSSHQNKEFVFSSPPEYVSILEDASIEAVNLSNNHSMDYLEQGLLDTKSHLDNASILWSDSSNYSIFEVRGVKIGMCGLDMVSRAENASTVYPLIDEMRELGCAIVIVSCHWGIERDYDANSDQIEVAHNLIDYGVDLVVGHHPHRLQEIEVYNGKYIFYSLSNFCFGGNTGLSDPDSCIAQVTFNMSDGNREVMESTINIIPFSQTTERGNDYCPRLYDIGSEDYFRVLDKLNWTLDE